MGKKWLKGCLCLSLAGILLAGCGKNDAGDDKKEKSDASDKIVWAGWSGEEDATKGIIKSMVDTFNEKSDVKAEWLGWPYADTQQQLIIRNSGSEQLDVAQVDITMFGALSKMGILEDVSKVVGEDYLSENFSEETLEIGRVDGQQLAVPWSTAPMEMVYNKELLEKVGYDEAPATIKEFEDCMKKLKELDDSIIPYGVATKEGTMSTDFQPWLWTFGGSLLEDGKVSINNEAGKEAVNWYKSLLDNDFIQMNITRFDARQMFSEGKMAFYDDAIIAKGVAESSGMDTDKIGVMKRPVKDEGDSSQAANWGHLLVVFKKSANLEAAGELIKTILSDDISLKYLESNGMPPVVKNVIEGDEVKKNEWVNDWLHIESDQRTLEFALMDNGSELNNIVVEELQGMLGGDKSIEDGLQKLSDRLSEALEGDDL